MMNVTPELIAKVKAAQSAEELLALAKENSVELTEEEAKTYFEQLNTNGAVSDDELENVAGGGFICDLLGLSRQPETGVDKFVDMTPGRCPNCNRTTDYGEPSLPKVEDGFSPKLQLL